MKNCKGYSRCNLKGSENKTIKKFVGEFPETFKTTSEKKTKKQNY